MVGLTEVKKKKTDPGNQELVKFDSRVCYIPRLSRDFKSIYTNDWGLSCKTMVVLDSGYWWWARKPRDMAFWSFKGFQKLFKASSHFRDLKDPFLAFWDAIRVALLIESPAYRHPGIHRFGMTGPDNGKVSNTSPSMGGWWWKPLSSKYANNI